MTRKISKTYTFRPHQKNADVFAHLLGAGLSPNALLNDAVHLYAKRTAPRTAIDKRSDALLLAELQSLNANIGSLQSYDDDIIRDHLHAIRKLLQDHRSAILHRQGRSP